MRVSSGCAAVRRNARRDWGRRLPKARDWDDRCSNMASSSNVRLPLRSALVRRVPEVHSLSPSLSFTRKLPGVERVRGKTRKGMASNPPPPSDYLALQTQPEMDVVEPPRFERDWGGSGKCYSLHPALLPSRPRLQISNQITAQEKDIVVLMRSKWAWGGFGILGFHLIRKESRVGAFNWARPGDARVEH
ncbi:hypothetical protein M431DRAFT_493851 [Trichoderma harzianum CBS 226.95]|uniref:Uncharacterized protein n=1 Tax=Trichoderma harzianum CBS 226.95 TaxID=983964 RepID=A0A2T4AE94_TRIHA|nr:hypothetical protein M431DRAFT_493851 [Trichoderma harzianum CBS 226.95]PTB55415.1 hypothetical protein M431DRAFT_493851 [Trichoderma harzianum CBS 226.95]